MNRHLEEQLQQLIDGQLDEASAEALRAQLKETPETLELYCQFAELDATLHLLATSQSSLGEEQAEITKIGRRRDRKHHVQITAFAAAAALILLGIVLRLTLVPERPALLTFRTSPDTFLSVTHDPTAEETPAPNTLAKGSRAILTQGTAEFNFANGIRAIVQAPADFTVHDDDHLFLSEGTAWFHVPKNAIGFQVRTAELLITDLGTEFGVFSTPDEYDEVQVFTGRVRVEALRGLKKATVANAGQAHRVDPAGRLKQIPIRPADYPSTLPSSLPFIHLSFDSITNGNLTATGTHPAASTLHPRLISGNSQATPLVPGVSGLALALHGEGDFVETDWYGIGGIRPRTIAFWIKIPEEARPNSNVAIVGWGDASSQENAKFKIHAFSTDPQRGYRPRVSFGGSLWMNGTTDLKDDHWHHFAITFSGKILPEGQPNVTIYIDGKLEKLTHRRPSDHPEPYTETRRNESQALRIGQGVQNYGYTFKGLIDELVIYDGVLSESSLQHLIKGHSPYLRLDHRPSK